MTADVGKTHLAELALRTTTSRSVSALLSLCSKNAPTEWVELYTAEPDAARSGVNWMYSHVGSTRYAGTHGRKRSENGVPIRFGLRGGRLCMDETTAERSWSLPARTENSRIWKSGGSNRRWHANTRRCRPTNLTSAESEAGYVRDGLRFKEIAYQLGFLKALSKPD